MKCNVFASAVLCMLSFGIGTQSIAATPADGDGIPIGKLIDSVAQKTSKRFVLDPRVRATVDIVGVNPSGIGYGELLSILAAYNFAAVEYDGYVHVLPVTDARSMPIPTVTEGKHYFDDEFVTQIVVLKNVPAAQVLPALRPMMPAYSHLSMVQCANSLVIVDRYANVKRIMGVIESLDRGEPYNPGKCTPEDAKR